LRAEGFAFAPQLWTKRGRTRGQGPGFGDQRLEQVEQNSPYHRRTRFRSAHHQDKLRAATQDAARWARECAPVGLAHPSPLVSFILLFELSRYAAAA
jgi:hypothetical protein